MNRIGPGPRIRPFFQLMDYWLSILDVYQESSSYRTGNSDAGFQINVSAFVSTRGMLLSSANAYRRGV